MTDNGGGGGGGGECLRKGSTAEQATIRWGATAHVWNSIVTTTKFGGHSKKASPILS